MNILVINAGSSSLKYQLLNPDTQEVLAKGLCERIGLDGKFTYKPAGKEAVKDADVSMPTHSEAIQAVLNALVDKDNGVIGSMQEIDAVGHRVVHGGEAFAGSVLITDEVMKALEECIPLAPLHNPANITGINACTAVMGKDVPQVAVFDTAFHQTMPPKAYIYAVPYRWYTENKVRRYGFHGTSHKYIAKATAAFLGKPLSELNSITMHLGNGSSMSAVQNGKCIDTSMGLTPLEGLMMGTRCGSIDPAIVPFMMEKKGMTPQEADTVLNKQSGLLGICGTSDMRDVHANIEKGDEKAALAFKMLTRSIKKVLGSYFFLLGNVDSIVFTAGIGENDEFVREAVCEGLEPFGIKVDKKENHTRKPGARVISTPDSRIPVLIIPTNEELEIATTTMRIVEESQK